jgi:hypothetical protein
VLIVANLEARHLCPNHRPLAFVEMSAMEVGPQHKPNWVGAVVLFEVTLLDLTSRYLQSEEAIATIKYSVFIEHDRFLEIILFDVLHSHDC